MESAATSISSHARVSVADNAVVPAGVGYASVGVRGLLYHPA
jgi:hypothetical protein